jgi:uncharacterized protein
MRLDRLLQHLLPKGDHFYEFFEESAGYIAAAAALLCKFPKASHSEREKLVVEIQELEHKGDDVTHKIFSELDKTFVTPFDREDIHLLASEMDDVLDFIDGSARRLMLYKIKECPDHMQQLMDCLYDSVMDLSKAIPQLRKLEKQVELRRLIESVNAHENKADQIFAHAIADLFENESNAIEIIKKKEVFVALETATDKCEDVANVLESILIKHA